MGFCGMLAASLFASMVVRSATPPASEFKDIEYAEQMPLAVVSLILDITRSENGFVAVGERGHVLISKDGQQWSQAAHVPTRSTLTSVFSLGNRLWAAGHDAVIITSGDAGNTWTLQNFDPDRQQAVMDIVFTDHDNGMAIGSYGLYLRSHDGGYSWQDETVDAVNEYHLNALVRLDETRFMIAGEAGFSYRSEDGGDSWEPMQLPYTGSMWGAIKTRNGCVLFYGLRGHVQESCDFGNSWQELETGTRASISGAAISDGLLLLVANSGTLLTRTEAGSFSVQQHHSGVDFAAALAVDNGHFLLVGEDGVHHFPESTGSASAGLANTGSASTGSASAGSASTGLASTSSANTGLASTDTERTGSERTYPENVAVSVPGTAHQGKTHQTGLPAVAPGGVMGGSN